MKNGYVYITPCGHYVVEGTSSGHGGMRHSFYTTGDINCATVFRVEKVYGTIGCPRTKVFKASIESYRAIEAKVIRTVELML